MVSASSEKQYTLLPIERIQNQLCALVRYAIHLPSAEYKKAATEMCMRNGRLFRNQNKIM